LGLSGLPHRRWLYRQPIQQPTGLGAVIIRRGPPKASIFSPGTMISRFQEVIFRVPKRAAVSAISNPPSWRGHHFSKYAARLDRRIAQSRVSGDVIKAQQLNVRYGSLADKPSRAKIHLCPLLSESGQTRTPLTCGLPRGYSLPFHEPFALVPRSMQKYDRNKIFDLSRSPF
jgi:hypothetical protein